MASTTEVKQEQAQTLETGTALVDINEMQLVIYKKLQTKYRLVDTLPQLAQKGFNQQLKSAINSAMSRQKTLHSDAIRVKNEVVAAQATANLDELEKMSKFL